MKINSSTLEYYGFDHKAVNKQFGGGLTFINEFCVNDEYRPVAVYKAAKPNRKKGHKKYVLLQTQNDGIIIVRGMSIREMQKWRYQQGVLCFECNDVIYSINRHDMHYCSCGNISIDGGRDYLRFGHEHCGQYQIVTIDLLLSRIKKFGSVYGQRNGLKSASLIAKGKR